MKVVLFVNHASALPVIDYFNTRGDLKAVISPERQNPNNVRIAELCKLHGILFLTVNQEQLTTTLPQQIANLKPDVALMIGFPYRISSSLFTISLLGFYNIHFSLLPAYRGSDPVFWQLKNGETTGGITIHQIDESFDTGPIIYQQAVAFINGENSGICNSRYTPFVLEMIKRLVRDLSHGVQVPHQEPKYAESYCPKPTPDDLAIHWDVDTAEQVESLVNACNPFAGGALTILEQQVISILEVSPVDGLGADDEPGGTIVHAGNDGLFVQCADRKILRINILKLEEGFLTGFKLSALGIKKGHRFMNFSALPIAID
jgi:methionyl-tRNA formyltransferase